MSMIVLLIATLTGNMDGQDFGKKEKRANILPFKLTQDPLDCITDILMIHNSNSIKLNDESSATAAAPTSTSSTIFNLSIPSTRLHHNITWGKEKKPQEQ